MTKDEVNSSLGPVGIEAARLLGSYLRGIYPDFNSDEDAAKSLYRRVVQSGTEERLVRRSVLGLDSRHCCPTRRAGGGVEQQVRPCGLGEGLGNPDAARDGDLRRRLARPQPAHDGADPSLRLLAGRKVLPACGRRTSPHDAAGHPRRDPRDGLANRPATAGVVAAQLGEFGVILHPADDADTWSAGLRDLAKGVTSPHAGRGFSRLATAGRVVLLSSQRSRTRSAVPTRRESDPGRRRARPAADRRQRRTRPAGLPQRAVLRPGLRSQGRAGVHVLRAAPGPNRSASTTRPPSTAARSNRRRLRRRALLVAARRHPGPCPARRRRSRGSRPLAPAGGRGAPNHSRPGARGRTPAAVQAHVALGMFNRFPRGRLLSCVGEVRDRSSQQGWDIRHVLGLGAGSTGEGDHVVSSRQRQLRPRVWGRPWPDEWESGDYVEVDLAATPPLLVDVMTTIDTLIRGTAGGGRDRERRTTSRPRPSRSPGTHRGCPRRRRLTDGTARRTVGRIVVFMGGSREAMAMVQRGLAGARDDLARAGVVVPSAGRRSHEANSVAHLALGGGSSKAWSDLDAELQAGGADTALLVMPGLLRLERADPRRTEIATRLAALGSDLCFVSVISDQLTMINSFYLHQVLTWRVSSRLEPFARRQRTNLQLRYDTLLEPWYDEGPGRYAPLPLTDLDVQHPVAAILRAAGATLERGLDVSDVSRPTRLGPVGVEANRLLGAYIRAVFSSLETERQSWPPPAPRCCEQRSWVVRGGVLGLDARRRRRRQSRTSTRPTSGSPARSGAPTGPSPIRSTGRAISRTSSTSTSKRSTRCIVTSFDRREGSPREKSVTRLVLHAGAEQLDHGVDPAESRRVARAARRRRGGPAARRHPGRWRGPPPASCTPASPPRRGACSRRPGRVDARLVLVSSDILSDALTSPEHTENAGRDGGLRRGVTSGSSSPSGSRSATSTISTAGEC